MRNVVLDHMITFNINGTEAQSKLSNTLNRKKSE